MTIRLRLTAAALALAPLPAFAADPPGWDWTGFYLGAHAGAFTGVTNFSDPIGPPLFGGSVTTPGFLAGFQAGYNQQVSPRWVLGVEADKSWLSSTSGNTCLQSTINVIGSNCKVTPRELATFTGRVGFLTEPHGRTMIFGRAGVAWMRADVNVNPNSVPTQQQDWTDAGIFLTDSADQPAATGGSVSAWGPTIGAGVEYALTSRWSLKMQYDYMHFSGISLPTPATTDVNSEGWVNNLGSPGSTNVTQNFHFAKLGLNYRFGAAVRETERDTTDDGWRAGWEFDVGARYWYSSGKFQTGNGTVPGVLLSRLPYNNLTGNSGEVYARVDTPVNIFVKGLIGTGGLSGGKMYDEDWGLSFAATPNAYEITKSDVSGGFSYFTVDLGVNVMRKADHKVGVFAGYNMYQSYMQATGCAQLQAPSAAVCTPNVPPTTPTISQSDIWRSVRVGVNAEAVVWDRLKLAGDLAWLPYVSYGGLDTHQLRAVLFPVVGNGQGVQAEVILSYAVTDQFSVGVGGRFWAMWTNTAYQTTDTSNLFDIETQRYGVFLQASYKLSAPR